LPPIRDLDHAVDATNRFGWIQGDFNYCPARRAILAAYCRDRNTGNVRLDFPAGIKSNAIITGDNHLSRYWGGAFLDAPEVELVGHGKPAPNNVPRYLENDRGQAVFLSKVNKYKYAQPSAISAYCRDAKIDSAIAPGRYRRPVQFCDRATAPGLDGRDRDGVVRAIVQYKFVYKLGPRLRRSKIPRG
jgi:hypothetical protein